MSHGALSSLDDHPAILPAFDGGTASQHGPRPNNRGNWKMGPVMGSRRSNTGAAGPDVPLGHGSMHRNLAAAAAAAKRDAGKELSAEDARVAQVDGRQPTGIVFGRMR